MKTNLISGTILVLVSAAMLTLFSFTSTGSILGKWETKPSDKGNVTRVIFKPDNSFEAYINKKPFASGTYTVEDDVLSFVDNGCNGAKGVYKIIFFASTDSMRFEHITDTCTNRKNGMARLILGRIKK